MPTYQNDPVISRMHVPNEQFSGGVYGESTQFNGVRGVTYAPGHGAVVGVSENHTNQAGPGVFGQSDGTGVWGTSKTWMGVYGFSESTTGGHGVMGEAVGTGVGVFGKGPTGGLFEGSQTGITAKGGGDDRNLAGFFQGNVEVTGTVKTPDVIILGADCAEDFDIMSSAHIEPGAVMVIGSDARLVESHRAYDKCVAGIVSGAGDCKPGIVLGKDASRKDRVPLALIGKVFCRACPLFS